MEVDGRDNDEAATLLTTTSTSHPTSSPSSFNAPAASEAIGATDNADFLGQLCLAARWPITESLVSVVALDSQVVGRVGRRREGQQVVSREQQQEQQGRRGAADVRAGFVTVGVGGAIHHYHHHRSDGPTSTAGAKEEDDDDDVGGKGWMRRAGPSATLRFVDGSSSVERRVTVEERGMMGIANVCS